MTGLDPVTRLQAAVFGDPRVGRRMALWGSSFLHDLPKAAFARKCDRKNGCSVI
jgi:hypothetical protein